MNLVAFGHTYSPAAQTRFASKALGCNQNIPPNSVQFGTTPLGRLYETKQQKSQRADGNCFKWALIIGGGLTALGLLVVEYC